MSESSGIANDELDLVIVRDMWLTGFDSPSMHTMYVDKPMRGAILMQAIARVNRIFRDKPAGLVVDYLGIAEDLRSALSEYTDRSCSAEAPCLKHRFLTHVGRFVRLYAICAGTIEAERLKGDAAFF